jgi:glycerophosphoryl diester phosphodiesterase
VTADLLLDTGGHPIIGHRGASGEAPENTIAAFDHALAQGAEALEFDVRLSADGVPVVFHDPTLDRTTSASGPLRAHTATELAALDAGARFTPDGGATFPFRDRGVAVPTLAAVLERFPDTPLLIELKVEEAGAPSREQISRFGALGRVVVASFLETALMSYGSGPGVRLGASRRGIARHAARAWLRLPPRHDGYSLYAVPDRYKGRVVVPTRRFVRAAHRLGCPVHVWTVNDEAVAEGLWDAGANGMITNFPARLLAARQRRFGAPRAGDESSSR